MALSQMQIILIIGGGELARMLIEALREMECAIGKKYVVMIDPSNQCSSRHLADEFIEDAWNDLEAARQLSLRCNVAVIEIETIKVEFLRIIAEKIPTYPSPDSLHIVQSRIRQKQTLHAAGLPVVPFGVFESGDKWALYAVMNEVGWPCIVKLAQNCYNGSGQWTATDFEQVESIHAELKGRACTIEQKVELRAELCVIVGIDRDGTVTIPPAMTFHKNRVLDFAVMPAPLPWKICESARFYALAAAKALGVRGLLAVEFFLVGDELYINECAARPHNGGHPTRIGCFPSQFRMLMRIALNLPLEPVVLIRPTAIANLLGFPAGERQYDLTRLRPHTGVNYEKEPLPGRKIAHEAEQADKPFDAVVAVLDRRDDLLGRFNEVDRFAEMHKIFTDNGYIV